MWNFAQNYLKPAAAKLLSGNYKPNTMARLIKLAFPLVLAVILLNSPQARSASQYKKITLQFGKCSIQAEIADIPVLQGRGLSGRKYLAEDAGMLFIFDSPARYSFWMKDMHFPLDLIWIMDEEVVDITSNVSPSSGPVLELQRYLPSKPVNYVLEVNVGMAQKCGVRVGDKIDVSF